MSYMAGQCKPGLNGYLMLPMIVSDPVFNPNDPSSQFYCDAMPDDPACYQAGGYYGPGGPGYTDPTPANPDPTGTTYTLPVQVFESSTPVIVGAALLLYMTMAGLGRRRKTKRGGI
jgi:hypothetical protein